MFELHEFNKCATVRDLLKQTELQAVLDLDGLTEVAVNCPLEVWFDRGKGWESQPMKNLSFERCQQLSNALSIYSEVGKLDYHNPIASVILPDGERGQICIPPASEQGVISFTIRKPSTARFTLDDYERTGRFTHAKKQTTSENKLNDTQAQLLELKESNRIAEFFSLAVKSKQNILLVGGTGSGKTTVMKAMVDQYPTDKRIVTIEDVHELDLPNHKNHLHLFYSHGGSVTPKRLIESCMRMKPDHVLLAELRGDEAWNYIEMLNTGHGGSITTIHANDCYSAYSRLAQLVKQSEVGQTLDYDFILNTIKSSIDVIAFFKYTHLEELHFEPHMKNTLLSEGSS
ncbi:P-type DNA transfer ATPase VirB11 [Enterovibrio calviensis]|uniref:P-type DNA transfer ATPase VirB11 n=1 Tax=Enterovibrio calviensis TaxID=91359 RepID=UPI003735200F